MKILMVLTSHDKLGDTGQKTGFWLEEFASPYYVFKDAGAEIVLASPKGGQPPIDPNSTGDEFQTDDTRRFERDEQAQHHLAHTQKLSDIHAEDFDGVFYPGGHGPLWDLTHDQYSIDLISKTLQADKPVAAVCHAPAVLTQVKNNQGVSLVKGKSVTGFSNSEEQAVQLTDVVPFLLEDKLQALGGSFSKGDDWTSFVQVDGRLITGQNPGSSAETARALLTQLV
ncbi:type 1 glutamine amidotransferase domain-containing protein [Lacimicrobium alkaliphilum]|uniref:Dimethylallyltransferase n=1 Tax=Lacimicrobium alkaliphilum TaxID=1526571 RepID=A0ABQ1R9R0_9ALTE|nr:type 1 glutamine amidotransferase domain-containing protein [Lacimicrobium alkaliphilum]GGD63296.1 dimethylallyltransferase [Lacimicrobium alkaliphilum]